MTRRLRPEVLQFYGWVRYLMSLRKVPLILQGKEKTLDGRHVGFERD